jgi:hypothetical protein
VGLTGKKRAEKEETAKNKGGFRVGFCVAFLKGVGEREVVHKKQKWTPVTLKGNGQKGEEKANGLKGSGVMAETVASTVFCDC